MASSPLLPLSAIVAVAEDGSIGDGEKMPWHLPDDFKWFKEKTMGHTLIMGRKTFESMGRPLPGRKNLVLSRNPQWSAEGVTTLSSLEEALEIARSCGDPEPFIIGGAEIFALAHSLLTRIYWTEIHHPFHSKVKYPPFDLSEWKEIFRKEHSCDEKHAYPFSFTILEKIAK